MFVEPPLVELEFPFWKLEVGFPAAPLAVGLFGLTGRLGPVDMPGPFEEMALGELGEPIPGAPPVPAGAVVAPGAVVDMPGAAAEPVAPAPPAVWACKGDKTINNDPIIEEILLISQTRSKFH